jgi:hypothetical protein
METDWSQIPDIRKMLARLSYHRPVDAGSPASSPQMGSPNHLARGARTCVPVAGPSPFPSTHTPRKERHYAHWQLVLTPPHMTVAETVPETAAVIACGPA